MERKKSGMTRWLEDVAEMGSEKRFRVRGRMTDFSQWCIFYKGYFLDGQCHDGCCEGVSLILEGQAVVLIVMGDISLVVHDQKFPEGHVSHLLLVFRIVLQ